METYVPEAEADSKSKAIRNTLMAESVVTPQDVRLALMDYADFNRPLYQEILSDEKLWKCIDWAVAHFNETPPVLSTKYTVSNFPKRKLLLDLAVVEALNMTALYELRGEMQYSDGGIQSSVFYKSPQFTSLRQELQQRTSQELVAAKRALNINSFYGHLC